MGKTRYKWWGFVKNIIRAYPTYKETLEAIRAQSITVSYEATGHGSEASRPIENAALRELPPMEMREFEAVDKAIEKTKRKKNGGERLKLLDMVFFKQTHTLHGAAMACNISYTTAQRWHKAFIMAVAKNFGLR